MARCMAGQIDNDVQTRQRLSFPVHRNVVEQAMFDLVPFARARREMTPMNRQAAFIGKLLQAKFPKAIATSVASAAVRRDENVFRVRIKFLAQMFPPTPILNTHFLEGIHIFTTLCKC